MFNMDIKETTIFLLTYMLCGTYLFAVVAL